MPPCASIHSSQCAPSPWSWPWAPSWTDVPASLRAFAPRAMSTWLKSSSLAIVRRRERRDQRVARREALEARVLPHVVVLIPVVLAGETTVGHDQRRRVADLRPREQRDDVLVQPRHRQAVLDSGVPVGDHRQVLVEQRAALGHDHQPLLARRLENHLARVATLLVVALDADGAGGLHPADVHHGVVVRFDRRLERRLGAVEDRAGREQARAEQQAGALHLALGEDRLRCRSTDRATWSRRRRGWRRAATPAPAGCRRRRLGRARARRRCPG